MNLNAANPPPTYVESEHSFAHEESLMKRIAARDEAAICELLELHGEMLARLVGRLLVWHSDCDDVLQEVLLSVWQRAGSYRGQGSLEGWLKKIALNRCRNHFRALSAVQRKLERFSILIGKRETDQPTPSTFSNKDDGQTPLMLALRKLDGKDRTAIVLFYLEEMPGEEVAASLGIKLETFHVRLHRARKKLKRLIEKENE